MARFLFSTLLVLCSVLYAHADKYYWVNGTGYWSDTSHWATTSGGTIHHSVLPGPTDTVYFDALSFNATGKIITVDTSVANCARMDWTGVAFNVEFNAMGQDTLNVYGSLILSDKVTFNFNGLLRLLGSSGVITNMDTYDKILKCDIEMAADTIFLSNRLQIPYNRLLHTDGSFNSNGHRVSCRHFNTASTLMGSVPVLNPKWFNTDSLTVTGSFALANTVFFAQTGPVFFQNTAIDTNYINMYANEMVCDVYMTGSKKMFLLSPFKTSGTLEFKGGGKFYSQNNPLFVGSLRNTSSLTKTISLGTSAVQIANSGDALYLNDARMTLSAGLSSVKFTYAGADTVNIYLGRDSLLYFGEIELPVTVSRIYSSLRTDNIIVKPASTVLLAHGTEMTIDTMTADGDCGDYIYLSSFCSECPACGEMSNCPSAKPSINVVGGDITVSYLKISYNQSVGDTIHAINSFALDSVSGWDITEPTEVGTMYWIGGTGNWNDATHWSNSSGGASGGCIPVRGNNVVFDAASFASEDTVFVDEYAFCNQMSWPNIDNIGHLIGSGKVVVSSNLLLHDSLRMDLDKGLELKSSLAGLKSITSRNAEIYSEILINTNGTYRLLDTLHTTNTVTLQAGNLNLNKKGLVCNNLEMTGSAGRTLNYTRAMITLEGKDTVWNSAGSNLTLVHDSGIVILDYAHTEQVIVNASGDAFDTLIVNTPRTRILGGGSSKLLHITGGTSMEFEPSTIWSLDSLITTSSCMMPVILSSFVGESGTATINKTGYDTLNVSSCIIQNVMADSTGGREYNALSSTGIGITTGWIFSGTMPGRTYNWTGSVSKNWHDAGNWHTVPATGCVPGPADTVVFNESNFNVLASDSVIVNRDTYCNVMTWGSFSLRNPSLLLEANLQVTDDVTLNDSLTFSYSGSFSPNKGTSPVFVLAPNAGHAEFDPYCNLYGVNTIVSGFSIGDTIIMTDSLVTDSTVSFIIHSGTLFSDEYDIRVGMLKTETASAKKMLLKKSDISIKYSAVFQDKSILMLDADSTNITMPGNYSFSSYFNGGNQRFYDFEMVTLFSDSATAIYNGEVYGADTFRIFKTNPDMHLFFEAGHTQTFDSAFIAIGTCTSPIYLSSTSNGVSAILNSLASDSIRTQCTVIKDINVTNGAVAVFSESVSNNTHWRFDAVPATTAMFTIAGPTCYGDSVHFVNTSTAYSGNQTDLTFEWYMEDTTLSSTAVSPAYLFDNNHTYGITLISTFTNGCTDTYVDSITIYKPIINLNSSDIDTVLCFGDQVTFTAVSSNLSPDFFYFSNGIPIAQSPDSLKYRTDTIANGEQIFAVVDYMGCLDTSNVYTFEVNPLPMVTLGSSDVDYIICAGDSVTLTASGASQYLLYQNGIPYNNLGVTDEWSTDTIENLDEFTVFGQNIVTGCEDFSSDTLMFTVLPLPMISLTSTESDTAICAGDTVIIYAAGAAEYIFYLNGMAMGAQSATDSVVISTLADNDIISVEGVSISGCRSFAPEVLEFEVEVTPVLSLISDDADSRICAGQSITFQSSGATDYQFYISGVPTGAFGNSNSFISAFTNGQTVTVQGLLGNCYAYADTVFTIDVRPTITWTYSDSVICANEVINLESDGDSVYEYFIDGLSVTPLQYDSVYQASGLTDGQIISVSGTTFACTPSPLTVIVNPVPVIDVACSESDTAICQGQSVSFIATGSETYSFYINGIATGPYSTVNVYSTTGLNNNDIITVQANSVDGCHSIASDTFIVEVAPNPMVVVSQSDVDFTICNGDTVSFSASGASMYEFFVTGASQGVSSTISTIALGNLSNGDIVTVVGTTGYCTTTSADVYQYTVNAIPNVTFSTLSEISVCTGDTIELLAGGATAYQFYIDGLPWGIASGNSVFSCDTLTTGQVISVEGILVGCTGISGTTYSVTVNDYPSLTFINDVPTGSICFGDTVNFEGNGAQNYTFYLSGVPVLSDSIFVTDDLQNGQQISLYGANGVCGVWADTVMTINVNYVRVALTSDIPSTAICAGSPVQFTASGADVYEFFIDGVSQGTPSAANTYSSSALANGQTVSVHGTSLVSGCTQSAFSDYYIHVISVPMVTASPAEHFCDGDSVLLSSSEQYNNHWYLDGIIISGAMEQTLWIYDGGSYFTEVSSSEVGKVFSCGDNSLGQFGDGTTLNNLLLQQAVLSAEASEVACGAEFTLARAIDGTLKAWGRNEYGSLGTGTYTDSNIPVNVGSLTGINSAAAGNRFGLALKSDGTVVSWGENTYGQLGYGNYSTSNFPFAVVNIDSIVDVAAGENHALALTSSGHVWAWGRNQAGQLGDSTQVNRNIPVLVKHLEDVVAIEAGSNHSMALKSDGTLWVWGSNANGQLGTGNYHSAWTPIQVNLYNRVISFDGGFSHTLVCDSMGIVYTWGSNTFGQLGVASLTESLFPVATDISGGAIAVKAGKFSSYALRNDRNLMSWGQNNTGQLGHSGTTNVIIPLVIEQTFAISSFDAGNEHLSVIPLHQHTCVSSDIVMTLDTVPVIDIDVHGLTLSTSTMGVSYQWYYNGSAVPGATGTSLTISAWGTYYVVIEFANGCSGFSVEYEYGVGMDEYGASKFALYPNPSDGEFTVMISGNGKAQSWRIINSLGQTIASCNDLGGVTLFEVSGIVLAPGVYSIQVVCEDEVVYLEKFTVAE